MQYLELLLMLIGSHFICDYVLQTDAIATGKNRLIDPAKFGVNWYYWMTSPPFTWDQTTFHPGHRSTPFRTIFLRLRL